MRFLTLFANFKRRLMDTFSGLIRQLLESSNMTARQLFRILQDRNTDISYPAIGSYKNYDSVPSFDRARAILDALEYEISDEDLADILQYSRDELKTIRQDEQTIQQGVRLSPKFFSDNINAAELRTMIDSRIEEITTVNGNFNSYISWLIKNDLTSAGYLFPEEDNNE